MLVFGNIKSMVTQLILFKTGRLKKDLKNETTVYLSRIPLFNWWRANGWFNHFTSSFTDIFSEKFQLLFRLTELLNAWNALW